MIKINTKFDRKSSFRWKTTSYNQHWKGQMPFLSPELTKLAREHHTFSYTNHGAEHLISMYISALFQGLKTKQSCLSNIVVTANQKGQIKSTIFWEEKFYVDFPQHCFIIIFLCDTLVGMHGNFVLNDFIMLLHQLLPEQYIFFFEGWGLNTPCSPHHFLTSSALHVLLKKNI